MGVPRILDYYSKDCFTFSDNFLRMAFPAPEMDYSEGTPQATPQVTPQVEQLLKSLEMEMSRIEIQEKLGLSDRNNFRKNYLNPAFETGLIEYTIPEKPKSSNQKYRLTGKGIFTPLTTVAIPFQLFQKFESQLLLIFEVFLL